MPLAGLTKKKQKGPSPEQQLLLEEYYAVKLELDCARGVFEQVTDSDLISAVVFEINALQKRYSHLLTLLREQNVCDFRIVR